MVKQFPGGIQTSPIGQGTWKMGSNPNRLEEEVRALQEGIDQGLTLIDTAEMYGQGDSEKLVGKAIQSFPRDELTLVSKVVPSNASAAKLEHSLDQSLKRVGVDEFDLYLLHWPTMTPLEEVVGGLEEMVQKGKIRGWGVSNFDYEELQELLAIDRGNRVQTNQVLYNLGSRGVEHSLLPFMKEKQIPLMAYTPIVGNKNQVKQEMQDNQKLKKLANQYGITVTQLILAWLSHQDNVIPIPKASTINHVQQNAQVLDVSLAAEDLQVIDQTYPPPKERVPLDIE